MAKQNKAKSKSVKPPVEGELTLRQTSSLTTSIFDFLFNLNVDGSFKNYRLMRKNPTIALARVISNAPIRTAKKSVHSHDDVSDEIVKFIQTQVDNFWPDLLDTILYSRDFGFQAYEKVWKVKEGKWVYDKLKALTPEITKPMVDMRTGKFLGLKQHNGIELPPEKVFWYVYDGEPGNLFGRSQHENIREFAWKPWLETANKQNMYMGKIAGVLPMVHYPIGESKDGSGATVSNYKIAEAILNSLGSGRGVTIPNELTKWASDLIRQGADVSQLLAWRISFLETKGQHGKQFTETLRHYESLMMRGWFVPERVATEGQFGTKAEASAHADIALMVASLIFADIIKSVNKEIINPLLVYNFGSEFADKVYIATEGLSPAVENFYRAVMEKILSAPNNVDLFIDWIDVDSLLDMVGLPKSSEKVIPVKPERIGSEPDDDDDDEEEEEKRAASSAYGGYLNRMKALSSQ